MTWEVFEFKQAEVAWNGDQQDPWIDIDLHTNRAVSLGESTIVGRLSLSPTEAVALAELLLAQHSRIYRKG